MSDSVDNHEKTVGGELIFRFTHFTKLILKYPQVGIVTVSTNSYFVTVTEAKRIVSVVSFLLRHKNIGLVTLLPFYRHKIFVPNTLFPLLTVNNSVPVITLLQWYHTRPLL